MEFMQRHEFRGGQPWVIKKANCIWRELKLATLESLRQPRLCYAVMLPAKNEAQVHLWWIEDYPSPDGIRLTVGKDSKPVDVSILRIQHDANQKAAENSVIFTAGGYFPPRSEEAISLWEAKEVLVVLTKKGQPVSNSVSLQRVTGQKEKQ